MFSIYIFIYYIYVHIGINPLCKQTSATWTRGNISESDFWRLVKQDRVTEVASPCHLGVATMGNIKSRGKMVKPVWNMIYWSTGGFFTFVHIFSSPRGISQTGILNGDVLCVTNDVLWLHLWSTIEMGWWTHQPIYSSVLSQGHGSLGPQQASPRMTGHYWCGLILSYFICSIGKKRKKQLKKSETCIENYCLENYGVNFIWILTSKHVAVYLRVSTPYP